MKCQFLRGRTVYGLVAIAALATATLSGLAAGRAGACSGDTPMIAIETLEALPEGGWAGQENSRAGHSSLIGVQRLFFEEGRPAEEGRTASVVRVPTGVWGDIDASDVKPSVEGWERTEDCAFPPERKGIVFDARTADGELIRIGLGDLDDDAAAERLDEVFGPGTPIVPDPERVAELLDEARDPDGFPWSTFGIVAVVLVFLALAGGQLGRHLNHEV